MKVVSTLLTFALLSCCVDAQIWQYILELSEVEPWRRFIELENFLEDFIFNQFDKNNINKGSFSDVCPKHCHCYKYQEFRSFYAKVKCFKRGLNQLPDWEIDPRVMLVCFI